MNDESREELNTASMLENGFWEKLSQLPKSPETAQKMTVKALSTVSSKEKEEVVVNSNTEKLLVSLFEIRDDMMEQVALMDINSDLVTKITSYVNKIGGCIVDLGGEVELFEPINHVSGLQMPSFIKNAERVVDNTMQCYKMGKITKTQIHEDNKTIDIFFQGNTKDTLYDVEGSVTALKSWIGNEAIDYIYTKGSGKMFVRAFEDGRWIDKSDQFEICWSLNESAIEKTLTQNKNEKKEEVISKTVNNDEEEDFDADFSIEEKE